MNRLKRSVSLITAAMLLLSGCGGSTGSSASSDRGPYETDGELTGSAQGMNGPVPVTVTVENGNITAVVVGENTETEGIGSKAVEELPGEIVKANSPDVDGVSGATVTSNAIKKATRIALGLEPADTGSSADAVTEADIIVVGGGLTGMVAAIQSANLGASVILLEQSESLGGNSRYAGGYISGAKTKLQEEAGIDDSYELAYADLIRLGGIDNLKPELAWTHVQRAGEMVNWVNEELGVTLSEPGFGAYTPTNVARVYKADSGMDYVNALQNTMQPFIDDGKLSVQMSSKVDSLIIDNNKVVGVTVGDKEYHAQDVILATGGYAYNKEWIEKYNFTHARSQSPATATGSGYDLAESAGASFSNMDYMPAYPGALDIDDGSFSASVIADATGWSGSIWVDNTGKRLFDEVGFTTIDRQGAWENAPENYVYMVFTQEMRDNADTPVLNVDVNNGNWDKFDELLAAGDEVYSGSTIEEAAKAAGIDPEGLAAEITKYNSDVEKGKDSEFGRTERLEKIESDTYYVIRTVPYVLLSKGGVDVNTKAQVLREDGSTIDGLYAGGELIGGANIGGHASHGGLACASTFVWGTIAAESAVSDVKGEETHVSDYQPISTELPDISSIEDPSAK